MLKSRFKPLLNKVDNIVRMKSRWLWLVGLLIISLSGITQSQGYSWTFGSAPPFVSTPAMAGSAGGHTLTLLGQGASAITVVNQSVGLGTSCNGSINVGSFQQPPNYPEFGLKFNNNPQFVSNIFTIELTVKFNPSNRTHRLIGFYDLSNPEDGSTSDYGIYLGPDNWPRLSFYKGGSSATYVGEKLYNPNIWYHLVFVRDANKIISVYVNGLLEATYNDSEDHFLPQASNGNAISFFKDNVDEGVNGGVSEEVGGSIAKLSIYNSVLSLTDIQERFNNVCNNNLLTRQVFIQSFDSKSSGNAATTHSLTGVPAGALLVLNTTSDAVPTNCTVSSNPSLTWTKRVDAGATSSDNAEIWTAVYSAGGSISVTSNWGNESQASVCYVVLNAESTLGGASGTECSQSAPSVIITTTRANSIIFGCTADYNKVDGATRTLRDAATERLYYRDNNYTTYFYTKAAAAVAAYTEGVSLPTGQKACTALLEIRGGSAPSAITNLSSTQTATTINLSWTAATDDVGITGYDVYVGGVLNGTTATTTYTVTGLTPLTQYSISVIAKDAAGNETNSNTITPVTTSNPLSLTTIGTCGAATYSSSTGVLNIPQYSCGNNSVTYVTGNYAIQDGDKNLLLKVNGTQITFPDPSLHIGRTVTITHNIGFASVYGTGCTFTGSYIPVYNAENTNIYTQALYTTADYVSDGAYWRKASHSNYFYPRNITSGGEGLVVMTNSTIYGEAAGDVGNIAIKGIKAGSGISLSSDNNDITITANGGGSAITADNGVNMSTATNVQLGGTLLQNTTINSNAFPLQITGSVNANGSLQVTNTDNTHVVSAIAGTASGVSGTGISGSGGTIGVLGNSTTGVGVKAVSIDGNGLLATSTSSTAGSFHVSPASTNTVAAIQSLSRFTSGTPANGIGGSIDFNIHTNGGGAAYLGNRLVSKWTDATHASRTSQFDITGVNNAIIQTQLSLLGSGQLQLPKYGVNTFAGTAAYNLGVDASGKIIEVPASGGVSALTADNGLTANTSTNVQLFGSVGTPATLLSDRYLTAADKTLNLTFNSLANKSGLNISSTSTSAAGGLHKVVEISASGANAVTGQSTYGIYSSNTHTGSSSTNYGGYFNATGGSTNYGIRSNGTFAGIYATGDAYGVIAEATGPVGSAVTAYNNNTSNGAAALRVSTATTVAASLSIAGGTTSSVETIMEINRGTSTAVGANGIGGSIDFKIVPTSGFVSLLSNRITSKLIDATNATRTSQFIITGVNNAVTADLFTLSGNGALRLNKYGAGTNTGTPAYTLAVDATGKLIETVAGGGGFTNPMTSANDMIIGSTGGAAVRLPKGTEGQTLSIGGGNVTWSYGAAWNGSYANSSTISTGGVTLAATNTFNLFTGSTAGTWTMPLIATSSLKSIHIKNGGTANLTLQGNGTDNLWTSSAVTSIILKPGASAAFINTNGYWNVYFDGSGGWALNGNTGTNPATNFIGTTDAQSLAFKTNNSERILISADGNVGIGTSAITGGAYKLYVQDGIRTKKVKVDQSTSWPDYVFHQQYKLPSLKEVEEFIQKNQHLPDVPSAKEIEKEGLDLGDNQAILLKKIEELTLYLIEMNKKVDKLAEENEILKKKLETKEK